jgi:hypothetical protein
MLLAKLFEQSAFAPSTFAASPLVGQVGASARIPATPELDGSMREPR